MNYILTNNNNNDIKGNINVLYSVLSLQALRLRYYAFLIRV